MIDQYDSPQTFFYLDPPYPGTRQDGYAQKFDAADFNNLIEKLKDVQGSFILSCYDFGYDVPDDWEKIDFKSYCSASGEGRVGKNRDRSKKASAESLGKRERVETIFKRGPRVAPRAEIQKLYDSGKYDCFKG